MRRSLSDHLALLELSPVERDALGLGEGALHLRRSWPRGVGHVLAEYRAGSGGPVPGQWFADEGRAAKAAEQTAAAARRHGGRALLRKLDAPPGGALLLQAGGADRRLAGLAALLGRPGAELLVHRPERRAVVRLPAPEGARYARITPPERAATRAAAEALATLGGRAFAVPDLLELDAASGLAIWSALPGQPLYELLGRPDLAALLGRVGAALRSLHAPAAAGERAHGPVEEADVLEGWAARATEAAPWMAGRLMLGVGEVRLRLSEPPERFTLIHRDLHDKQIFIDGGEGVGLLDFDTLAAGEPALDLGNMIAHLELRALQGRLAPERVGPLADALLEGYEPAPDTLRRLPVYREAARLRLACVYAFRPRWLGIVPELLGQPSHSVVASAEPPTS